MSTIIKTFGKLTKQIATSTTIAELETFNEAIKAIDNHKESKHYSEIQHELLVDYHAKKVELMNLTTEINIDKIQVGQRFPTSDEIEN